MSGDSCIMELFGFYKGRAVVSFLKVVRPLNIIGVHRVMNARVGGGEGGRGGGRALSRNGGLGDLPKKIL